MDRSILIPTLGQHNPLASALQCCACAVKHKNRWAEVGSCVSLALLPRPPGKFVPCWPSWGHFWVGGRWEGGWNRTGGGHSHKWGRMEEKSVPAKVRIAHSSIFYFHPSHWSLPRQKCKILLYWMLKCLKLGQKVAQLFQNITLLNIFLISSPIPNKLVWKQLPLILIELISKQACLRQGLFS